MAKMKIYEIARSIQQQDKNIKSGDLVTLLNENGFEVKGANSNIEDEAIGFLMNYFKKKKAAAKAEPKEEVKAPVKEEPKVEKKEEPKVEKKVEEKKEEPKVEKKPEEKKPEEKKPEEKKPEEKAEKKPEEKKVSSQKPQQLKKNDNYRKPNNNGQGRNDRNDRNDRDRRNGNGNGSRPDNRGNNGNNNGRRNDRNDRDRRGNNNGQNSRGDNRRNGNGNGNNNRVFERFEKAQSGFDGIKQEQKNSRQRNRKKDDRNNKTGGYRKSTKEEMSRIRSKKDPNRKGAFIKPEPVKQEPEEDIKQITIPESLTIRELADKMKMPAAALVKKLFMQGQMVSLNQEITFDEAEEIALSFDIIAELEEKVDMVAELLKEEEEDESKMKKRPPVVCVMGHVDHGKTSLLDAIRETDVTEHEAGGITQHIGAYVVRINGEKITFLDTPGHEAFTSMRMRGAQSTDVAVLVVAADDGVMPQTVEAINHAKAAGVEIIVAINKIDKEGANIERVKQELSEYELIPEEWGGSTIFCPVSAHTKEGISNLLEMIILTAEVLELKANPKRRARGIVIEAQLDKGRGPVATVLVQKGTLNVGDHIAVGTAYGKVRAMLDHKGERVKQATPSTPVEILGLNGVPSAGEIFVATENDKEAKQIAQAYVDQGKDKLLEETKAKKLSLDGLFSQIQAGNVKELNLIIKADVQGSVEAVKQSLVKLSNEEVAVRVIHGGVGAINESDVSLASASNAIIIGFNIRLDNAAKETADRENVDVRLYRVIYDAIEDIEAAMKGMLEPIYEEKVIAHAEVRQTFKASGVGTIAGSYVLDGKIERGCRARITREGEQIFEGDLSSLKRFKDDVKEVAAGYECGLVFDGFNDLQEEDQIECYKMVEVPR
ncbi:translation initiation factor IF-2 [Clostridium sp. AF37-5]|uniref:translation initiation factor IF-2 n=1 Tax=Clostridium sp. AF37-5 TaxID=2293016 RepID=UPI000E4A684E|nr:translation initiation factor IF-2 [Clostridium sp. AF37-5]RHO99342.1 translation initiation factor IF-2 [Clostridium sp. AF37-5]